MFKFDSEGRVKGVNPPYTASPFLQHDSNCVTFYVFHKNQLVGFYNLQEGTFIDKITSKCHI